MKKYQVLWVNYPETEIHVVESISAESACKQIVLKKYKAGFMATSYVSCTAFEMGGDEECEYELSFTSGKFVKKK